MRISTFRFDPGYCERIRDYDVTLNGRSVLIADVLLADSARGLLVTQKRGSNGQPVYQNGSTVTVIESGKVVIKERSNVVIRQPEEVPFA